MSRRFRVALSFAWEKRQFVAEVACLLAMRFVEAAVLYVQPTAFDPADPFDFHARQRDAHFLTPDGPSRLLRDSARRISSLP
jgi:hypothetical protein